MKLVISYSTISLLVCSNLSLSQESAVVNNQIVVYGTASLEKPADRAQISFSVKGFGKTLQAAVDAARTKIREISGKLFSIGLKESNLYTSSFNSGDNFEGKAFLSSSRDYRTQIDVMVTVDTLDLVEPVVSILANSLPDRLSNISFALRSDSLLKLQVRQLAVANAQQKAKLMTGQLGIDLGKVLFVEELLSSSDGDFYISPPYNISYMRMATSTVMVSQTGATFFGQRFAVKSGVKVIFEIKTLK